MPIYEYRCDDCRDTFEVLTSFANRDHAQACPTCNGERSQIQVSRFAAVGAGPAGDELASPAAISGGGGGCACGGACGCGGH